MSDEAQEDFEKPKTKRKREKGVSPKVVKAQTDFPLGIPRSIRLGHITVHIQEISLDGNLSNHYPEITIRGTAEIHKPPGVNISYSPVIKNLTFPFNKGI